MNIVEKLFTPFVSKTKKIRLGLNENNSGLFKYDGGYVGIEEPISSVKKLISFGVGGNIDFETHIEDNYNISIDMFDGEPDYQIFPEFKNIPEGSVVKFSDKINYHKYHITKDNINSTLPQDNFILKMDIEGAEWDVLRSITDSNMKKIKMLQLEFHLYNQKTIYDIVDVLVKLKHTHTLIHIHGNNHVGMLGSNQSLPAVLECCYVLNEYATNEIDMSEYPILNLDYPNDLSKSELPHTWWK